MSDGRHGLMAAAIFGLITTSAGAGAWLATSPVGSLKFNLLTIDWNTIAAIATASATLVALWSSWKALREPERARLRDRHEATREVLRASRMAIVIFRVAYRIYPSEKWKSKHARRLGARAAHLRGTLDRLLAKPHLTDGVITTGVGAMQILSEVVEASNIFFRNDGLDFGDDAQQHMTPILPLLGLVRLRYRKVRAYIDKQKASGKLM